MIMTMNNGRHMGYRHGGLVSQHSDHWNGPVAGAAVVGAPEL